MSPRPCSSASTQTGAPIAAQQTAAAPAPEEVQQPTAASGNAGASLMPLIAVMDRLLAPDGCAWDREQTLATLRSYLVEECYELVEAIDSGAPAAICEELGDVLFQVVFQSALCQRAGWFGLDAVAQGVTDKLVRRHPHVFGDDRTQNRDEAIARWEAAKAAEKGNRGPLDGVPKQLPALLRALRIDEKARAAGYPKKDAAELRARFDNHTRELHAALAGTDRRLAEKHLGLLLWTLVRLGAAHDLDAEQCLRQTLDEFTRRFQSPADETASSVGTR